jgi:hypothetical protein
MSLKKTLETRAATHGDFKIHAEIELALREFADKELEGKDVSPVQRIGLGMIIHKMARILTNGHNHADSWEDLAGYALRVSQDMTDE